MATSITERILEYNAERLSGIVELKYGAMTESLFRFYRGTNHIFFADLTAQIDIPDSPTSWISGDLHIENFGSFKGNNRQVYFDLNDFDEGVLAPAIWECYRMVTSIFVAFESLHIEQKKAVHMAQLFLRKYSETLALGKSEYIEPNTALGIVKDFLTAVSRRKQKDILAKKTIEYKNKLAILMDDPRHINLKKKEKQALIDHVTDWLKQDHRSPYNYKPTDAVFRLAGTGSLGLKRYAVLLKSVNENGEKYLLLDIKQAISSSLKPYLAAGQPVWINEAERAVCIQSMMQNHSPALLSTMEYQGMHFMVQEIQPTKDKINFKLLRKEYRHMISVVSDMAVLAASSQLRSSGRMGSCTAQELIDFGTRRDWQQQVMDYSGKYAYTFQTYYSDYLREFKQGRMKAKVIQSVVASVLFCFSLFAAPRNMFHSSSRNQTVYNIRILHNRQVA